jgi:hypothetical protein
MKSRILSAIVVMLVVALPAAARAPIAVLEDGREVDASFITLPTVLGGPLSVGCPACLSNAYVLSTDARFYVGQQEVTLADLKAYLVANPEKAVLLVSPRGENVVTRIKAQR